MVVYTRMKKRLFKTAVSWILRVLLQILSGSVFLGRGIRFLISAVFGKSLVALARVLAPGVTFFYLKIRGLKKVLQVKLVGGPPSLAVFGSRYLVHALVVLLVVFASVPALSAADAPPGVFGEGTLLKDLLGGEELIVDDLMPSPEELDYYLEARFQNQQIPEESRETPDLLLTLEGGTLVRPDLPGTTVLQTRTEIVQYEVQSGDTPWAIAEQFGVSVATVLWANNMNLYSTIRPGQTLTIPPISGILHTVKKGDTLASISKRYSASVDEIKEFNSLVEDGTLAVGASLVIPGGRPYVAPVAVQPARRQVTIPPAPAAKPGGKLLWPTSGRRITQYFQWRHQGLDIGGKNGVDPIYASENGVVEYAGWGAGGWGNTVVVDHGGGMKTRYSHASKVLVSRGAVVTKGQVIAMIGSTGRSTGPHIDFRIYINGRSINPLEYLR